MLLRLLLYWFIGTSAITGCLTISKIDDGIDTARRNIDYRSRYVPYSNTNLATKTWLDHSYPLPRQIRFWQSAWRSSGNGSWIGSNTGYAPSGPGYVLIFAAWPWITLLSLLIFRYSMRQAKIRRVHLLRATLYGTDFGFLLAISFLSLYLIKLNFYDGPLLVFASLLCAAVTSYRLTIAFKRYLRVHLPFATVLASQLITFLAVFTALAWIADFARSV